MTEENTAKINRRRNYGEIHEVPTKKEVFIKDVVSNRWFYLAVATLLIAIVLFRWEVNIQHRGDGIGPAYVLDRWTGTLYWVTQNRMRPVNEVQSQ